MDNQEQNNQQEQHNEEIELIQLLIESGQDVNKAVDEHGTTPLLFACEQANLEAVEMLLENGADVNVGDVNGVTPLMVACEADVDVDAVMELVGTLIEAGANVNASAQGITPLFLAACWEEVDLMDALVENGADVAKAIQGAHQQMKENDDDADEVAQVIEALEKLQ